MPPISSLDTEKTCVDDLLVICALDSTVFNFSPLIDRIRSFFLKPIFSPNELVYTSLTLNPLIPGNKPTLAIPSLMIFFRTSSLNTKSIPIKSSSLIIFIETFFYPVEVGFSTNYQFH